MIYNILNTKDDAIMLQDQGFNDQHKGQTIKI